MTRMEKEAEIAQLSDEREMLIRQTIAAWKLQNRKLNSLLNKLSSEELLATVAPNRNRGIYILGHLIAFNDMMLPLLGFQERLYPELDDLFVCCADGASEHYPSANTLKAYWYHVNEKLSTNMNVFPISDWFVQPGNDKAIGLKRNPLYNKYSVLISRTTHLSYHIGQLILLF
jgi:hypothetical protein